MKVEIDPYAGFCFGVDRTINLAESKLSNQKQLYCLGEIVHNPEEISRLEKKGLTTLSHSDLSILKNSSVLVRAHGEPPETYRIAEENNISLIEGTCPVVTKLHEKVRNSWDEIKEQGGQLIICGKKDHPEIIGLNGQANKQAIIITSVKDLDRIDFRRCIHLFAQTTFNKETYQEIITEIKERIKSTGVNPASFKKFNSICGQVSNRIPKLVSFCNKYEIIVFVSGKNSSNGKFLFNICKKNNPRSHHISSAKEIDERWFQDCNTVGISGATSTPLWLMNEVSNKISQIIYVSE